MKDAEAKHAKGEYCCSRRCRKSLKELVGGWDEYNAMIRLYQRYADQQSPLPQRSRRGLRAPTVGIERKKTHKVPVPDCLRQAIEFVKEQKKPKFGEYAARVAVS